MIIRDVRTCGCGQIHQFQEGQRLVLAGWVQHKRDHGQILFIVLRDRTGECQLVAEPKRHPTVFEILKSLPLESVIQIEGLLKARPPQMVAPHNPTGAWEVEVQNVLILNEAQSLPFHTDVKEISENLRLRYRYLDLRRPQMQNLLHLRHRVLQLTRQYFSQNGFWEVETPYLYKSTPEGARDFLVPARLMPGHFYALTQSPQLLKQMLMVSGVERYFQVVRCFRDEDLRADRQPEFTQVDFEMSFVDETHVQSVAEGFIKFLWSQILGVELTSFPRLTYEQALKSYGSDKPDLRLPWVLKDVTEDFYQIPAQLFEPLRAGHWKVVALGFQTQQALSRGQWERWTQEITETLQLTATWLKWDGEKWQGPWARWLNDPAFNPQRFLNHWSQGENHFWLAMGSPKDVWPRMGQLRSKLASWLGFHRAGYAFVWIQDFPLFEWDESLNRWVSVHHPFTSPRHCDWPILEQALENPQWASLCDVRARSYDLVCNGYELGGGSIRIHEPHRQKLIFQLLGFNPEQIQEKFGFFLESLGHGAPPHGGMAFGLDRLVMILAGVDSIRDVIPFPKTTRGQDLLSGAPSPVDLEQLIELHLTVLTSR